MVYKFRSWSKNLDEETPGRNPVKGSSLRDLSLSPYSLKNSLNRSSFRTSFNPFVSSSLFFRLVLTSDRNETMYLLTPRKDFSFNVGSQHG